jgi:hypothetical protein
MRTINRSIIFRRLNGKIRVFTLIFQEKITPVQSDECCYGDSNPSRERERLA